LRAMLALPIRRRELILCKSLGASISLLVPFAIAYFIEIGFIYLAQGLPSNREDLARTLLIFGLGALYGIIFVHLGLFISTITARTKIAVTTALLSWSAIVLVLPNAAVLMAKLLSPAPSYNQFNARLYEARRRVFQEEQRARPADRASPEQPVSSQTM